MKKIMKKKIVEKLSELERRDKFLTELEETCPIHYEGTDIVVDVSLDAESILQNLKNHKSLL